MVQPNAAGHPPPPHPVPPPGLAEYISMLFQNGSFPPLTAQTTVPPAPSGSTLGVPLPTEGRSFTQPGHGQGGALAEKKKVSRQIMATATKRKSLVEPDVETQSPSTPDPPGKKASGKLPAKHAKTAKVACPLSSFSDY